jgi:hypothetical protein
MFRFAFFLIAASLAAQQADTLYTDFQNPPTDARPFVRWWWNGLNVTEKEILRELDVMKAGGIGGVEINSIQMPPQVPAEELKSFKALDWLSPEWNRMVKTAAEGARQRGMTPDLIVGSGWPFGGRFLPPEDQIQRISLLKREVTGPQQFRTTLKEFARQRAGGRRNEGSEVATEPRLAFLRLVPAGQTRFDPGADVMESLKPDGTIDIAVPEGKFTLYGGLHEIGFSYVKLGAPGADGPVVDHLNARAVRKYLDHLSSTLGPALGGKLGNQIRAMFVDSLELDRANWTGDFAAEFEKRRGYALAPYLPFVLDNDSSDTIRRARYDFVLTLIELFQERFVKTYIDWCHENGVRGRIQAYGRETHPLEGSMHVDLPEGESWLWGDGDKIVPMPAVVNKYVSSGAHLAGKQLVSFEAMTNAVPVFRETLEDIKIGLDMSLLTGVNHPVLHGFNYTPPEAGFPGWVRFGCYFNEKNPWWPYFRQWADYSARMTAVLRQTTATAQVAVLGPRADEWSREGMLYQPFPEVYVPWYHYHLWQALQQNGVSTDYISENILRAATFADGEIRYAGRRYEAVILQDVESLEPATAEALERYAKAGGKIAFVGRSPSRAPGLKDDAAQDALVRRHIEAALRAGGERTAVVPAPEQKVTSARFGDINRLGMPLADRENLLAWSAALLERFAITPEVRMSKTSPWVSHIHQQEGSRDLFFFANTSRTETAEFEAVLPVGDKRAWHWDPFTGKRQPYPQQSNRVAIRLEPEESLLLVFTPGRAGRGAAFSQLRRGADAVAVKAAWRVSFQPMNGMAPFERKLDELIDIGKATNDPALTAFGGTAIYRTEFNAADSRYSVLDLGQVHGVSEVTLNGKKLGVRWHGRHVYNARGAIRKGSNRLEVKVTTMPANYAKSLAATNAMAKRWAGWFPLISAGLVGPVELAVAEK